LLLLLLLFNKKTSRIKKNDIDEEFF